MKRIISLELKMASELENKSYPEFPVEDWPILRFLERVGWAQVFEKLTTEQKRIGLEQNGLLQQLIDYCNG